MSELQNDYTKVGWAELADNQKPPRPDGYEHPWPTDERYVSRDYDQVLGCEHVAFCINHIRPGQSGQHHRHLEAEEIHVLMQGRCRMRIGNQIIEAKQFDAIRVPASVPRSFYNHSDGDCWWLVIGAPVDEFREESFERFISANRCGERA